METMPPHKDGGGGDGAALSVERLEGRPLLVQDLLRHPRAVLHEGRVDQRALQAAGRRDAAYAGVLVGEAALSVDLVGSGLEAVPRTAVEDHVVVQAREPLKQTVAAIGVWRRRGRRGRRRRRRRQEACDLAAPVLKSPDLVAQGRERQAVLAGGLDRGETFHLALVDHVFEQSPALSDEWDVLDRTIQRAAVRHAVVPAVVFRRAALRLHLEKSVVEIGHDAAVGLVLTMERHFVGIAALQLHTQAPPRQFLRPRCAALQRERMIVATLRVWASFTPLTTISSRTL